jgi:CRP/FNR family transcriptional regulator, cyclic AMP receptor protein
LRLDPSADFDYIADKGIFLPPQSYPAGSQLYVQGAQPIEVYWIIEGLVKAIVSKENGDDIIISLHSEGTLLGLTCAISQAPYPATAITLSDTIIRKAESSRFLSAMENDPALLWHVLRLGCAEAHKIVDHIVAMIGYPAARRLESFLLDLIACGEYERTKTGLKLSNPLTQKEISQWIAVSPEHFNTTVS